MKPFLIGMSLTGAMLLGWEVGEWMQAEFGAFLSWCLWLGAFATMQAWLHRGKV